MIIFEPPQGITATPFVLDDVVFVPDGQYRIETAVRCEQTLGDILFDGDGTWRVRKVHLPTGEHSDWKPMRCAHEARAFLVSRVKQ